MCGPRVLQAEKVPQTPSEASEKLQATEMQEASRKLQLLLKDRKNVLKDARTEGEESESPEPPRISPKPPKIAL